MPNKLFQNQYRIPSARASWWDYRTSAPYFITICTHHREYFFGEIENGIMNLNDLGKQAQKYWDEIPMHCPFVELINVVVMPNHVHGLVYLHNENADTIATLPTIETLHATSLQSQQPPKKGSLSSVIRSYKSAVTKYANENNLPFAWQSRFHDHIVRNSDEYQRIFDYITHNPTNWETDKFYGSL